MNKTQGIEQKRSRNFILTALFFIVLHIILVDSVWEGSKALHTIMEVVATILALFVGILSLLYYYANKSEQLYLFVGIGFFGTAFLDGYHAVVTSVVFDMLFPSDPSSLIPWSWVASRMFLAVFLYWSYLQYSNKKNSIQNIKLLYLTIFILTLLTFLFFAFVPLPRAYYPELFFHRPEELIPALFFALALKSFYKHGEWKSDTFQYWLVLSLIVSVISQLVFMSFSNQIFDINFDIAHLLKKLSYILVLTGLLVSIATMHKKVKSQSEELLKQHQFLQEQSKLASMGEMIGAIAHQWRQPLNTISTSIQNLKYDYLENHLRDEEYIKEFVNINKQRIQFMSTTIDDFRNFFRTNKFPVYFNLYEATQSAININYASLNEAKIKITLSGIQHEFKGHKSEYQQVILNLINNAKDALMAVPVKNPTIAITITKYGVIVKDNGTGIPEDILERIFEPYFTTKEQGKGTGMGLYMSRMIIENMHGKLKIKNNNGAQFTIEFMNERFR